MYTGHCPYSCLSIWSVLTFLPLRERETIKSLANSDESAGSMLLNSIFITRCQHSNGTWLCRQTDFCYDSSSKTCRHSEMMAAPTQFVFAIVQMFGRKACCSCGTKVWLGSAVVRCECTHTVSNSPQWWYRTAQQSQIRCVQYKNNFTQSKPIQ